jgi:hypothetical protein
LNAGIGAGAEKYIQEDLGLDRLLLYKKSKAQENHIVVIAEGDKIGKIRIKRLR